LVQFGRDNDWQTMVRSFGESLLLIKRDGSLWQWGPARFDERQQWPGLASFEPRRVGTDSDWATLHPSQARTYGWKRDGTAWSLDHGQGRTYNWKREGNTWSFHTAVIQSPGTTNQSDLLGQLVVNRFPVLDNTRWKQVTSHWEFDVGIRADGTLWAWRGLLPSSVTNSSFHIAPIQMGTDSDWASVASYMSLVAVKTNGTLWRWDFPQPWMRDSVGLPILDSGLKAVRIGTQQDWLAVGSIVGGVISLSADGNLWRWNPRVPMEYDEGPLIACSRRPMRIENIFENEPNL
jgi:alpha-tubulin suppressor-like RCC1 family protein